MNFRYLPHLGWLSTIPQCRRGHTSRAELLGRDSVKMQPHGIIDDVLTVADVSAEIFQTWRRIASSDFAKEPGKHGDCGFYMACVWLQVCCE
jgi:hypothetical protein